MMDVSKKEIVKLDKRHDRRDVFTSNGYMYVELEEEYLVAGRLYIHCLNKHTLDWTVLNPERQIESTK